MVMVVIVVPSTWSLLGFGCTPERSSVVGQIPISLAEAFCREYKRWVDLCTFSVCRVNFSVWSCAWQYLALNGDGVVDVEQMALDLQAQYSEYSRKKRGAFQQLVSSVYHSNKHELCVGDSKRARGLGSRNEEGSKVNDEELWLVQRKREQEHAMKGEGCEDQCQ